MGSEMCDSTEEILGSRFWILEKYLLAYQLTSSIQQLVTSILLEVRSHISHHFLVSLHQSFNASNIRKLFSSLEKKGARESSSCIQGSSLACERTI